MTIEGSLAQAKKKVQQMEHQKILKENLESKTQSKSDLRRAIFVGNMFIRHFPITLRFSPRKTEAENKREFEPLDHFMKALAQCHRLYQEMEDRRSSPYDNIQDL